MRTILHIDMNSYFATVEQQANPKLRDKPVAVLGSKAKRSIIVAASIEAKKFGVKTGTRIDEAPQLCPDIIFVHGEPRKYSYVTKKFIEIFEDYTDKVEIFSIDEAFLDITKTQALYGGAVSVANEIKRRIREEIGEYISCSVGVASNKFLAKLGSDMQKPDGLVIITEDNRDDILLSTPLNDLCGIGRRIYQRLGSLGIYDVAALRNFPQSPLGKEFGIATSQKLKRMAYGLDSAPVISWREQKDAKTFSHSRTLNKDVTSKAEIKKHILLLSEKVAKRMRDDDYVGKEVALWIKFKDFTGAGQSHRVGYWICDGLDIYKYACQILDKLTLKSPVRAIHVSVNIIQRNIHTTASLLEDDKKNEIILGVMDSVNNKFGSDVLVRGDLVGVKMKEIVSGMGRKKF